MLPSAIDDEPAINIFKLLEYWGEEPPTHVILALRYLGQRKKPQSEDEARSQLMQASDMMGQPAAPWPPHLREMLGFMEEQEQKLKGSKHGRKS